MFGFRLIPNTWETAAVFNMESGDRTKGWDFQSNGELWTEPRARGLVPVGTIC